MSAQKNINWDEQPLGEVSDCEIARTLGVDSSSVSYARKTRGIPPKTPNLLKGINWDEQPLGKVSDMEIARTLGVNANSVFYARKSRGIPPKTPCFNKNINWDEQPLGKVSDMEIARTLGVNSSSVSLARKRRGIPPATTKCVLCGEDIQIQRGKYPACSHCANYVQSSKNGSTKSEIVIAMAKASAIANLTEEKILKRKKKKNENHE